MSDTQQKFINLYVDKAIGMLHEYLSTIIQLRTQLQMANDLIQEKDQVIASFTSESEKVKSESTNLNQELETARNNARQWEDQYNAMKNKVSHMDTLTSQYNEMKTSLISRNEEVDRLNKTIEQLKNPPKKVINTKKEKSVKIVEPTPPAEIDDF